MNNEEELKQWKRRAREAEIALARKNERIVAQAFTGQPLYRREHVILVDQVVVKRTPSATTTKRGRGRPPMISLTPDKREIARQGRRIHRDTGNWTKAAQRLQTTPRTLKKLIKMLEDEEQ